MRSARWLALLGVLLAPRVAFAQTEPGRVELVVITEVPQYLGGGASVGLGRGLRLQSTAGASVSPYVDAVTGLVSSVSGVDPAYRDALRDAVDDFVVWRTHLLWRPWRGHGFELGGGYGLVVLRGEVTEAVTLALANEPPNTTTAPPPSTLRAYLHQVDVEAAWRFSLASSLSLRVALGVDVTAYAHASISPRYAIGDDPAARDVQARSEATLTDWVTRWRALPSASVALHLTL